MLDVVVVMDPIGSIKIAKDSTFAMLLEAQRRGHRLLYVCRAACRSRRAAGARVAPLRCAKTRPAFTTNWATAVTDCAGRGPRRADAQGPAGRHRLPQRHPGPGLAQRAGALVVNDPQGLRDLNEKLGRARIPAVLPADPGLPRRRPR
jgi:glutathione synthase